MKAKTPQMANVDDSGTSDTSAFGRSKTNNVSLARATRIIAKPSTTRNLNSPSRYQ